MEQKKKNQWLDMGMFVVLLLLASYITFVLFYRQSTGEYFSDMEAYILEMQGLDSGYSFPYPIFFRFAAFINMFVSPELAIALAITILNGLSMVLVKLALNRLVLRELTEGLGSGGRGSAVLSGGILSLVAISLFFVSMLFPPEGIYLPGIRHVYLGVFTANPFHNATYMAARPFTILAFFQYCKLLLHYEEGWNGQWKSGARGSEGSGLPSTKESRLPSTKESGLQGTKESGLPSTKENGLQGTKESRLPSTGGKVPQGVSMWDYLLFSLFLLVATMTKPSFTIVLVGTAGLIMLYRLLVNRFRNFKATICLGLCFIPTFVDLLYQFGGVFVPRDGAEGGIGFTFGGVWRLYCDNIPLAVCLAAGFPLLVLALNYRELKRDVIFRFSWQLFIMSFLMAFILYEKGFREVHFNFIWGYMYGVFFCFAGALLVLLRATARRKHPLLLTAQWLAYLWHVACGLYYFGGLLGGALY